MRIPPPPTGHHAAAGRDRIVPRSGTRLVDALDVLVSIVELALLAVLAVAGARLGSQATAITLALLLPLASAVLWGLYLAPRASRRLPHPRRLATKLAVMLAASALLAASGATAWGFAFLLAGGVPVTVGECRTAASRS
jgi:Protein of unknown function (DUF2568)